MCSLPLPAALNFALGAAQQIAQTSVPLTAPSATCPMLNLTLGPLDLNLLELTIHLQINLVLTEQFGPGNLLGNLRLRAGFIRARRA